MPSQRLRASALVAALGLWADRGVTGLLMAADPPTADQPAAEVQAYQKSLEGKLLYMTSTFPVDLMPIDLVVEHQMRQLGIDPVSQRLHSNSSARVEVIVFENHPPWLGEDIGPHGAGLRNLRDAGVNIERFNYSIIDDPTFLDGFYDIENQTKRFGKTLRKIFGEEGERRQKMSNFVAMQTFLNRCLADKQAELCMYADPDILFYSNTTANFFDLAAGVFNEHPQYWVVQPPYGCFDLKWWSGKNRKEGVCRTKQAFVSSRHMVVNRTRLAQALPLKITVGNRMDIQYHEVTLTEATRVAGSSGQMLCGSDFFALHPPGRFQQRHEGQLINLRELLGTLAVDAQRKEALGAARRDSFAFGEKRDLFAHTARSIVQDRRDLGNASAADSVIRRGTEELIRRFEAGRFIKNSSSMLNDACSCCSDMLPSYERIEGNLAFARMPSDSFYGINEASFDWVMKCHANA